VKNWLFTEKNFYLFGLSAFLLILGYVFLAQGPVENPQSKSLAPLILVAVYCGLVPFAILYDYGKDEGKEAGKTKKQ
jgi:pilus assembly protein TadC